MVHQVHTQNDYKTIVSENHLHKKNNLRQTIHNTELLFSHLAASCLFIGAPSPR